MKRGIYLIFTIFTLFLLFGSIAIAADEEPATETLDDDDTSNKVDELKDQVSSTKLGEIGEGTKEKAENVLKGEAKFPDQIQFLYLVIAGVGTGTESISWEELIVIFLILIILFIISLEILEFTAFETNWVRYIISGGIVLILGLLGAVKNVVSFVYGIVNNLWVLLGIVTGILIALFILRKALIPIKNQRVILRARELGTKAGASIKGLSNIGEAAKKATKE